MIATSLYRDDGLTQVEIAPLLGRDKSWVSRRIALIERLSDEVLEHLRLGLISPTHGRELSRLPRGNQPAALSWVIAHRLCSRETAKLVSLLIERPRWDHELILTLPLEILEHRQPPRRGLIKPQDSLGPVLKDLARCCASVLKGMDADPVFPSYVLDASCGRNARRPSGKDPQHAQDTFLRGGMWRRYMFETARRWSICSSPCTRKGGPFAPFAAISRSGATPFGASCARTRPGV